MKRKKGSLVFLLLPLLAMVLIWPVDCFTHGFYSDVMESGQPVLESPEGTIAVTEQGLEIEFVPVKKHFAGFMIRLGDGLRDNRGSLRIRVLDEGGAQIDEVSVDISQVSPEKWYDVHLSKKLKRGRRYVLKLSAVGCEEAPVMPLVNRAYLPPESVSGNLLIGYAYAEPWFGFSEKVLITVFLAAGAMTAGTGLLPERRKRLRRNVKAAALFAFLSCMLAWNFTFNAMDSRNTAFSGFQKDSEALAADVIAAEYDHVPQNQYGLGTYNVPETGEASPVAPKLRAYKSQYGLQGKIFCFAARISGIGQASLLNGLRLVCGLAAAAVFTAIVMLIAVKYNRLMAGCFYVTFWLSPWIVNFAENLYWVEFTWFLPMLAGLFCSLKIDSRRCRVISYVGGLAAVTVKSLCGYEYISSVMMGLIAFLLADFAAAVVSKDKEKARLMFRTVFIMGAAALLGFAAALLIHGGLRGDGDISKGIKDIIEKDVLRRTYGASLSAFDVRYWDSLNASLWEVLCRYFHFSTQIITGIEGNLFPLMCLVPLVICWHDCREGACDTESIALYAVFLITAVSWFVLAKSHSYIHTHMNYVLWYFGFVQICFYIICERIVRIFFDCRSEKDRG